MIQGCVCVCVCDEILYGTIGSPSVVPDQLIRKRNQGPNFPSRPEQPSATTAFDCALTPEGRKWGGGLSETPSKGRASNSCRIEREQARGAKLS